MMRKMKQNNTDSISLALADLELIEEEADTFLDEFDNKFGALLGKDKRPVPGTQRIEYRYHKSSVDKLRNRREYRKLHRGAVQ